MRTLVASEIRSVSGGREMTAGEGIALGGTIGGGVGAAKAIAKAGGLGQLGTGAIAAGSAAAAGLAASFVAGYEVGTYIYENSEMVREVAGGTVERIATQGFRTTLWQGVVQIFGGGLIGTAGRTGHLEQ